MQAQAASEHGGNRGGLLDQLVALHREAMAVLDQAKQKADGRLALHAVREAARVLELQARLLGELRDRAAVEVNVAGEQ